MLRFQQIVLKDCPPVGNLVVDFDGRQTAIVAGNGFGKTALCTALRTGSWPYGGSIELTTRGSLGDLAGVEPLVFIDDNLLLRDFSRGLSPRIAADLLSPKFWSHVGELLANDLRLDPGNYRYRGTPYAGSETFDVHVTQDWEIVVQRGEAARRLRPDMATILFDSRVAATDEQIFLRIAMILAMRKHIQLDAPLVVDEVFGVLDMEWTRTVARLINSHVSQSVLVCSGIIWSRISEFCTGAKVVQLPRS